MVEKELNLSELEAVSGVVSTSLSGRNGFAVLKMIIPGEVREIKKELLYELRKKIVDVWESMTENKEIEKHFKDITEFDFIVRYSTAEDIMKNSDSIFEAFSYIMPFEFEIFEGNVFLSKVDLFEKRKSPKDVIEELKKDSANYQKILQGLAEKELNEDWLIKLFERANNPEFLKSMREDWKEILKRLVKGERNYKVVGAFVKEENYKAFDIAKVNNIKDLILYTFIEKQERDNHCIEVYSIRIKDNKVKVKLENKYTINADKNDLIQEIVRGLEEKLNKNTRFHFIAQEGEKSIMRELLEKIEDLRSKSRFIEHEEMPMLPLLEDRQNFVLYTSEFYELTRRKVYTHYNKEKKLHDSIAVKSATKNKIDVFYSFIGYEEDKKYKEELSLLLLDTLTLLNCNIL